MIRDDDPRFRITPVQQMASACTGALITSLFMTPLDVVKIRLQAQQRALLSNKCYLYCNGLMEHLCPCGDSGLIPKQQPPQFHGTLDAFYKITKLEGVGALWSGLSPTLVLALPCTVIYFVSYEQLRYRLKTKYNAYALARNNSYDSSNQPFWIPMIAGGIARIIAVTLVSPLELIRTKMQSKKVSYSEINLALRQVVKFEGYRGLFRGLGSTLLRDVPFSGIYWTTFETARSVVAQSGKEKTTFLLNFGCGCIAGAIAAFVTVPFDVLKTHQQIELGEKEIYADLTGKTNQRASSMKDIWKTIYRTHGYKGLFAGLLPRVIKVAPACAIMIATFEYGKQFFQQYNTQKYKEKMQRPQEIVLVSGSATSGDYS